MRYVCILFFCALTACSSSKAWLYPPVSEHDLQTIYVVSHGWHTGLVVPAKVLNKAVPFLANDFPEARFYEVGWGDHEFYQAEKNTLGLALKALLWPGDSVLHVVGFSMDPEHYFSKSEMVEVELSNEASDKLNQYIRDSFEFTVNKQKVGERETSALAAKGQVLRSGLYGRSYFYEAHGTFHLFNTCNSWVAQALDHAGVPMRTFMNITSIDVVRQTREAVVNNLMEVGKEIH